MEHDNVYLQIKQRRGAGGNLSPRLCYQEEKDDKERFKSEAKRS